MCPYKYMHIGMVPEKNINTSFEYLMPVEFDTIIPMLDRNWHKHPKNNNIKLL